MKNKIALGLAFALLALSALSLSACNTAEGFGKDLESAGKTIQNNV